MSEITSLYRRHFQKSRIFLFPVLGIGRGTTVTPVQTYIGWEGYYKLEDMKLICVYTVDYTNHIDTVTGEKVYTHNPMKARKFADNVLLSNSLLDKWGDIEEELDGMQQRVYVFNFPDKYNWNMFLTGKYSKFTPEFKKRIKTFFHTAGDYLTYVDSYINPWNYYSMYSEILGVNISILKEVVELCEAPALGEEVLHATIKQSKPTVKQ